MMLGAHEVLDGNKAGGGVGMPTRAATIFDKKDRKQRSCCKRPILRVLTPLDADAMPPDVVAEPSEGKDAALLAP